MKIGTGKGLLMAGVNTGVNVVEQTGRIRGQTGVHAFIVKTAKHTHIGGDCVRAATSVQKPLLIEPETVTAEVRKLHHRLVEILSVGTEGITVEMGGGITALTLY